MMENGVKKLMLKVQYRMHPDIRKFPSDVFYGGEIKDDDSVTKRSLGQLIENLIK